MRRYTFLARKPGMPRAAFSDYWRHPHARLIAGIPAFWQYTARYIQNHVRPPLPGVTTDPGWDGLVELWQKPGVDLSRNFGNIPERKPVDLDEPNFMDLPRKLRMAAEPHVIVEGPESGLKIFSLIRRGPGASDAQFRAACDAHRAAIGRWARRHVENRIIAGSVQSEAGLPGCDCIGEVWCEEGDAPRMLAECNEKQAGALRADWLLVEPVEIRQPG